MQKILVIDDQEENIQAAIDQFGNHPEYDLTTASGYEDAKKLIEYGVFEIVMCDLMMPFQSPGFVVPEFISSPTPYGLYLALLCLQKRIKKIIVISNGLEHIDDLGFGNHHSCPASLAFDDLNHLNVDSLVCIQYPYTVANTRNRIKDWLRCLEQILIFDELSKTEQLNFETFFYDEETTLYAG
jgi:CheY-like chemotaxis protein